MYILGIETSCDETSAAILHNNVLVSLVISNQTIHQQYGGVVPELASRAHQQNIVPVVEMALRKAGISKHQLNAIAFTLGPGLPGSLMVGVCFAKTLAWALRIPAVTVDHLHAHLLVHFIHQKDKPKDFPDFPLLGLVISGGHTLFVRMKDHLTLQTIGKTIDDAAGEVFDKAAKMLNLPYPGGPVIDKYAADGNPQAFSFAKPKVKNLDFSFSGLKTSILYFLRDRLKENPKFIEENLSDLCASIQHTIVEILMEKIDTAIKETGLKTLLLAGGVAANSYLRKRLMEYCEEKNIKLFLPELIFTTDNGAMIAIAGYYKYLHKEFASLDVAPYASGQLIF